VTLAFRWRLAVLFASPPQSGLAWLCFLFPLIEPDRRFSRIRLSDRTSCFRPRKVLRKHRQTDESKLLVEILIRVVH
jgi:hypothetical protein